MWTRRDDLTGGAMDDALKAIGDRIVAALPGAGLSARIAFGELTLNANAGSLLQTLTPAR